MASCKECVHVEVCRFKDLPAPLSDSYIRESECIEKRCGNFKDRSRFVELPCKVGEKIFYFDTKGRIHDSTVTQLIYGASGFLIGGYQIGKTVFLTREAAEQSLKEREAT